MIRKGDFLRLCLDRTGNVAIIGLFEVTAINDKSGTYTLQFRDMHRDDPDWNPYLDPEAVTDGR